ncbi:hypothetical protein Tco_1310771 [Tanacetum coccineum]
MRLMTWLNDSNTKLHAGKRIRHQALSLVNARTMGYGRGIQGNQHKEWKFYTKILCYKNQKYSDTRENNRILEEILRTLETNSPVGEPEGSDDYTEVTYDKEQCLSDHYTAPVTPTAYIPSIPFLATMEPADTLLMGDECFRVGDIVCYYTCAPTDNGEVDFDINSPLGEQVVKFLMENVDVAGLPRHLVNPQESVFDDPLGNSDSMSRSIETSDLILEELTTEIALDGSIPTDIDDRYYDSEGDILYFEQLHNEDSSSDVSPALLPT